MSEKIIIGPPRRSSLKGDGSVKRRAVALSVGASGTTAHAEIVGALTKEEMEQSKREAEETTALSGWDE